MLLPHLVHARICAPRYTEDQRGVGQVPVILQHLLTCARARARGDLGITSVHDCQCRRGPTVAGRWARDYGSTYMHCSSVRALE